MSLQVDDLVDGLIRLMNQDKTIGPVNLGNPGEFTIKQLAELAVKLTGSPSKITCRLSPTEPGHFPKRALPSTCLRGAAALPLAVSQRCIVETS